MGCGCEKDIIKAIETKYNLVHIKNDVAQDIVCTLRGDVMSNCPWLKVGRLSEELKIGDTTYPKCFPFFEFVQV